MNPLHTIAEVVQHVEERFSNPHAFNYLEDGHWKHLSTESFLFDLKRLTYGLISLGLRRGDKVGILAHSSPQWNIADLAIIMAGGISVPLFAKIAHDSFIYEVALANIRFLFVQGEEQWGMFETHQSLFENVIALDDPENRAGVIKFHEILQKGELLWEKQPRLWDELKNLHKTEDVATIIYTAGSTGMPKGVLLTHQNLCHLISFEVFGWGHPDDIYLSVLPLAHVFARQINLILIAWGVSIYYLNDLSRLGEVCREIRPTLMIVVPRLLEKMYDAMLMRVKGIPSDLIRGFSLWAFRLARDPSESFMNRFILRPIADFFIYSRLREGLGGRWRVILCGGAALNPDLNRFFLRIGIPIYEGWGLSEGSTACVNLPGKLKVGTVGPPLPGVKVKLGENDEILIAGPTVMRGYYRNPNATRAAIDEEGWLHTGDKGSFDKDGFLKIIGLVKEQFKLSSGEYIVPSRIEQLLCQHPLIDMALVVGQRQKHASCLLFPDFAVLKRMKKEKNCEALSDEEFLNRDEIRQEIEKFIETVNKRINSWEKIVKWRFLLYTPTIEAGDLTPTLKLKRDTILEKFHALVEELYEKEGGK